MSVTIQEVACAPGWGSYYYEDIEVLQQQELPIAQRYTTAAKTPGFHRVREPAEVVSIGLRLSTGHWVWGDAVGVSYSAKAGREGCLRAGKVIAEWQIQLSQLRGLEVENFRKLWASVRNRPWTWSRAFEYGLSQALLRAVAQVQGVGLWDVFINEWQLPRVSNWVPLHGSAGADAFDNVDKMIARRMESLPHLQGDQIESIPGVRGEKLLDYAKWLRHRVEALGGKAYQPQIHFDMHGALGKIFPEVSALAFYLENLQEALAPLKLSIECPVLGASFQEHLERSTHLRKSLRERGISVKIVLDEWIDSMETLKAALEMGALDMLHIKTPVWGALQNSGEAIQCLRKHGKQVLLGGSCIETDLSTQATVHLALAFRPDLLLAKPGMGIDEAFSLVYNEMSRALV